MFPAQEDPKGGTQACRSSVGNKTDAVTDPATWSESEIRLWLEKVSAALSMESGIGQIGLKLSASW